MKAFSVRELKNNPSVALRAARDRPVMVLSRNVPEAVLMHLDEDSLLSEPGIRRALALVLYGGGGALAWSRGAILGIADGGVHRGGVAARHRGSPGYPRERGQGGERPRSVAKRLVAADASPLIGLAVAGACGLLRDLFGVVTVTRIVRDEVMAGEGLPGAAELSDAIKVGWVTVVDASPDAEAFPDLHDGESSTLVVARDHTGPRLVVMDERLGRSHAEELGLPVVGVAGILIDARKQGLVGAVKPLLDRLEWGGFRLAPDIVRIVQQQAGEGTHGSGD